ncbi:MAG: hypothetical protein ACLTS6_13635 [Anaerobutyricum sp.]
MAKREIASGGIFGNPSVAADGDPMKLIHWKLTGKTDRIYV